MVETDVRIEVYDNRIEIISPGGLPIGITEKEYLEGRISITRNKIIADVFFRLGIIERLATGIRRIREYYKDYKAKPEFFILENSITVILPNVSVESEPIKPKNERITERMNEFSKEEQKVIKHIIENNKINRIESEELLNLKKTHAVKFLNRLIDQGIIIRVGGGKNTYYILNPEHNIKALG